MSAGETSSVAALLQIGFMLGCLVLVVLVHSVRRFDLRSLAPGGGQGGAAAEETGRSRGGRMGDMLERPDMGAIVNLLVLLCTGFAVLVGWRVPAEIERIYGAGAGFGLIFPSVEMTTLGRAAQVVGAVCLGLSALRLLRLLVPFVAALLVLTAALWAVGYIFRLELLPLP